MLNFFKKRGEISKILIIALVLFLLLVACKKEEDEKTYAEIMLGALDRGKMEKTKGDIEALGGALNSYLIDNSVYPETMHINDLTARLAPAYIHLAPTTDAWGRKLVYSSDGRSYQLICLGADGQRGTSDDIVYSDGRFIQLPTPK